MAEDASQGLRASDGAQSVPGRGLGTQRPSSDPVLTRPCNRIILLVIALLCLITSTSAIVPFPR